MKAISRLAPLLAALGSFAFPLAGGVVRPVASAYAEPSAKAGDIADLFVKWSLLKSRWFCIDTLANCSKTEPPSRLHLQMAKFEYGSDALSMSARESLDQFAKALLDPRLKQLKFAIDGHADASGSEAVNRSLSERRAAAVVAYLASRGLDISNLKAMGFGSSRPLTADRSGPENRRVEIRLIVQR